jgi:hypothetical protein
MNVLGPHTEELSKDLYEAASITDTPNRKSVQLIPTVVSFFYPVKNVKIKLSCMHYAKWETLEIAVDAIQIKFKNTKSQIKLSAFVVTILTPTLVTTSLSKN